LFPYANGQVDTFQQKTLTKNQSCVLVFYKVCADACVCLDKSDSTRLANQGVSMSDRSEEQSDLERISRQVEDLDEQEKLRKFLLIREEIESDPNFLTVVNSLAPDEEWIGQIFTIPIVWLSRPRREAQFLDAVKKIRPKLEALKRTQAKEAE